MEIMVGDIILINHYGESKEFLRHPFLVIETNEKYFVALQVTAPKFDQYGDIILSNEFISNIYKNKEYIECNQSDGFKYVTWVLISEVYKIDFGKNQYEIEKVSSILSSSKLEEIIYRYNKSQY